MRPIIASLTLFLIAAHSLYGGDTSERTVKLGVMTWYHPVLEPGVANITLLCSVVQVHEGQRYESPYWNVRLRIEERIHVADRFAKRLQNVQFIESGDFRKRAVGDRLILFAGLGEPYEGDDFLLPCWRGTTSDLGIVLTPENTEDNERLLESLREKTRPLKETADSLEAFAAFCPSGVAHHLIMKLRRQERQAEEAAESQKIKP